MANIKIYIKMCEKAIEVQNLHKPAVCDLYVCSCESCKKRVIQPYYIQDFDIDYLNKRDLTNVESNYAKMVRSADVCSFVAFYYERCDEYLSYIWLPRQDQLQGMIYEDIVDNCEKTTHWELKQYYFEMLLDAHKLYLWYQDEGYDYNHFDSMEQLWLAFVMKEKFNKVWNGEGKFCAF